MKPSPTERKRGAGFPIVALDETAEQLKRVGAYGTDLHINAFAEHLGHSTANSGPFKRRLAGFRDWGVVVRDGTSVKLTDLGKRIAFPEDPARMQDYLREAFFNCEVFGALYKMSAKGVDLEALSLANTGVHNFGISVTSKERFAKSFMQSAIAAGLATRVNESKVQLLPEDSQVGLPDQSGERSSAPEEASVVLNQNWPFRNGQLSFVIKCKEALTAEAFLELRNVVEAIDQLRKSLGPVDESNDQEASHE